MMYYTYMLRCKDGSLYTGMTNDLNKRMKAHFSKNKNGAKYTKSHEAWKVEAVWSSKEKVQACRLEYQIKNLTKWEKENLIETKRLNLYLKGKVDGRRYRNLELGKVLDEKYCTL